MEHTITTKKWYVVSGTAGATVKSPDGSKTYCTIPEGRQGTFYATTSKVVTSDDSVEVVEATFNSAPVKLKLLGLLGGGASTGLPVGYLAAEFLESTGTQYIADAVGLTLSEVEIKCKVYPNNVINRAVFGQCNSGYYNNLQLLFRQESNVLISIGGEANTFSPVSAKTMYLFEYRGGNAKLNGKEKTITDRPVKAQYPLYLFAQNVAGTIGIPFVGRFYFLDIKHDGVENNLRAAVDADGKPCLFDITQKKPSYNSGTGQFIVGMTLAQARKLSKLPSTGGTLTVSLPSNYAEDEGVVNALATAQENGWIITIQTYEAKAGAASTFALRRIWVRKTQDEQGSYVDTDGFRWQVDWCVDVVGSSPEAEGYEPFRSVDVAVNYWNLQPWVDPEQEKILTNTNEQ